MRVLRQSIKDDVMDSLEKISVYFDVRKSKKMHKMQVEVFIHSFILLPSKEMQAFCVK
jgi:hypothetical protein